MLNANTSKSLRKAYPDLHSKSMDWFLWATLPINGLTFISLALPKNRIIFVRMEDFFRSRSNVSFTET